MPRTAWKAFFAAALFLCANADAAAYESSRASRNYNEVLSRQIGPRSQLTTNNTNAFRASELPPNPVVHANCDLARFRAEYGSEPCGSSEEWVCSRHFQISTCVDRRLATDGAGYPRGNMNRADCANYCSARGKRLPTNNEWLVACTGSPIDACLNYRGEWPPGYFARISGHPCQIHGATSRECFTNIDLTRSLPPVDAACRSEAGIEGCVGTLGQWVSGNVARGGQGVVARGRFNGGLFPQPASSVIYTTTAHSPDYSDYSMGCRCAKDTAAVSKLPQ